MSKQGYLAGRLGVTLVALVAGCTEPPSTSPTPRLQTLAVAQKYTITDDIPAVTMDLPPVRRPWDNNDDALVDEIDRRGGDAVIAFKLPASRRVTDAGGFRAALPATAFAEGVAMAEQTGAQIVYVYRAIGAVWVRHLPAQAIRDLRHNPLVDYIEPSITRSLAGVAMTRGDMERVLRTMSAQTTPWGISLVNAPLVWSLVTGANVKIEIIDQGVSAHEDLPSIPSGNCGGAYGGCDADDTHGTHVSGTAFAQNNSIGVVGVAPGVQGSNVLAWGACSSSSCFSPAIAAGIDSGRVAGVRVINMSLGGTDFSSIEANAVGQAWQAGVVLVAAAGNLKSYWNPATFYPAGYTNVVGVSGVKTDRNFADTSPCVDDLGGRWRSNWDWSVDLAAPFWALSTVPTNSYADENQGFCGTSMATPHVTGVFALLFARNPTWTNSQAVQTVFARAQDRGTFGVDPFYGYGIVDAAAAVGTIPIPTASIAGPTKVPSGGRCTWTASASGGTAPYTYAWSVDDVNYATGGTSFTYTNTGSDFVVYLWVTDANNQVVRKNRPVTVSTNTC